MTETHSIAGAGLTARIKAQGAELCSLIAPDGTEMLWQAGPAWPRHAPILFPIVGTLAGGRYRHQGQTYAMGRHGFARDLPFAWETQTANAAHLVLTDTPATRDIYPFAFRFEVSYRIGADGLAIAYRILNTGNTVLPASMGAHPAFNWPLRPGTAKTGHTLTFETDEPQPIRRVGPDGLLRAEPQATPIRGRVLALQDSLFADDAIIVDHLNSRSLRFGAPRTPTVEIAWEGFTELGIWTRPGLDLLCIEPWCGVADPAGFAGEIAEKPFIHLIPPGGEKIARHWIRITV